MDSSIAEQVTEILSGQFGIPRDEIRAEATMADLDVDSLTMVEFGLVAQKTFGVKIPEDAITPDDTVGDLVRMIEKDGRA
jgi:acyl carrier protein